MNTLGTSICIERSRKTRLNEAAQTLDMTVTELVSMLLNRVRSLFPDKAVIKQRVKYQRFAGLDEDLLISHIELYDVDYEYATSRRYVYKISVSFLIRLAIDFFLDEILRHPHEAKTDHRNYVTTNSKYRDFSIDNIQLETVEYWLIPWARGQNTLEKARTNPSMRRTDL